MGKAKGNRQLVKPRHIWEETVKIDLKTSNSIVWYCMNWIHLAQDREKWWTVVVILMVCRI